MNKLILMAGLGSLLAACSSTSADGQLTISNTSIMTEYRDATDSNTFYGCDTLVNEAGAIVSRSTQVKVGFQASGSLSRVKVRLDGLTANTSEANFTTEVNASNTVNFRNQGSNQYAVIFTANSGEGATQLLPYSNSGGIQAQAITVSPTIATIKRVRVDPNFRVNPEGLGGGGRFIAYIQGFSGQGSDTKEVFTLKNIPVYSQCTLVEDTGVPLVQ